MNSGSIPWFFRRIIFSWYFQSGFQPKFSIPTYIWNYAHINVNMLYDVNWNHQSLWTKENIFYIFCLKIFHGFFHFHFSKFFLDIYSLKHWITWNIWILDKSSDETFIVIAPSFLLETHFLPVGKKLWCFLLTF